MKKVVFVCLLLLAAFVACDKDDSTPYFASVGSIEKTGDLDTDFVVNLDDGDVITPIHIYGNYELTDGERVVVEYDVIEEKSDDTYDVNIYDIDEILTKAVIQLTEQNRDSIANDPIYTSEDNIWISEKHLNIVFKYLGYGQTHFINLARPLLGEETHDDEGRLILEFRHNANSDFPQYWYRGIVSFELESLRVADEASVDFVVRVKMYDNEDYEFEGSYTFESESQSASYAKPHVKLADLSNSKIK